MNTHLKNINNLFLIALCVIISLLTVSCSSDDNSVPNSNSGTLEDDPQNTTIQNVDKELFGLLKKAGDEFDKNDIWKGYSFSSAPMYFVYRDKDKNALRGFIIAPGKEIKEATKINNSDNQGIDVYRYDKDIIKANKLIKEGNDAFDFNFMIDGVNFYLQVYTDNDVNDKINNAIDLATHEVFHKYQFDKWAFVSGSVQNQENYPINKDLLALQILTTKIAEKMPIETNQSIIKKYLEMYVAIRHQEMAIDISPEKLVKNMANAQEHGEGTAKYIETLVSYKIFPSFNLPFIGVRPEDLENKAEVRNNFAWGIWYETGAAVCHMLRNQGVDFFKEVEEGKTLYDIAKNYVNLSSSDMTLRLEQAKGEFNWAKIQNQALQLSRL